MEQFLQEHSSTFADFRLLDTGDGYRLEQWGKYRLARPDPQIIWKKHLPSTEWDKAHAVYTSVGDKGGWNINAKIPGYWDVGYIPPHSSKGVSLRARLTPFKHTAIFAEQAANWDWMANVLRGKQKRKILNLFGYTGAATVVLTSLGHNVTHVDASKPAIGWAKDNQSISHLPADSIRWILDDAQKFVMRELKRGQTYDGIIMDPPAFGHSPDGRTWKFNQDLPYLLGDCIELLSPDADFLLVNGYATNSSAIALKNVLEDTLNGRSGSLEYGELCLQQQDKRLISTGIFARWNRLRS